MENTQQQPEGFDAPIFAVIARDHVKAIDITITDAWKIIDKLKALNDSSIAIVTADTARRINQARAASSHK